jgi:putative phosphoserine phosphatase/1-acylglycerol-3-phosphate O-acyltransferase
VWNVFSAPEILINVGQPVPVLHESEDADTKAIMKAITALLPAEARKRRKPTDEEIRLATPANMQEK